VHGKDGSHTQPCLGLFHPADPGNGGRKPDGQARKQKERDERRQVHEELEGAGNSRSGSPKEEQKHETKSR
jgi:hypothetical protein